MPATVAVRSRHCSLAPRSFRLALTFLLLAFASEGAATLDFIAERDDKKETCPPLLNHHKPLSRASSPAIDLHDPEAPSADSGSLFARARIVGGQRSPPDLAAYMAYIEEERDGRIFGCTGVIVAPDAVLTTFTCANNSNKVAISGPSKQGSTKREVSEIIFHPNARVSDSSVADLNNIAIIRLEGGVLGQSKIAPLERRPTVPITRSVVRVVGYGALGKKGDTLVPNTSGFLRQVDLPAQSAAVCYRIYGDPFPANRRFCAGYRLKDGCGACTGDLGAGIFQYQPDGTPVLIGLFTGPNECGSKDRPVVGLKVHTFLPWILQQRVAVTESVTAVQRDAGEEKEDKKSLAPIIGGVVGGVVALLIIPGIAAFFICRNKEKRKAAKAKIADVGNDGSPSVLSVTTSVATGQGTAGQPSRPQPPPPQLAQPQGSPSSQVTPAPPSPPQPQVTPPPPQQQDYQLQEQSQYQQQQQQQHQPPLATGPPSYGYASPQSLAANAPPVPDAGSAYQATSPNSSAYSGQAQGNAPSGWPTSPHTSGYSAQGQGQGQLARPSDPPAGWVEPRWNVPGS